MLLTISLRYVYLPILVRYSINHIERESPSEVVKMLGSLKCKYENCIFKRRRLTSLCSIGTKFWRCYLSFSPGLTVGLTNTIFFRNFLFLTYSDHASNVIKRRGCISKFFLFWWNALLLVYIISNLPYSRCVAVARHLGCLQWTPSEVWKLTHTSQKWYTPRMRCMSSTYTCHRPIWSQEFEVNRYKGG